MGCHPGFGGGDGEDRDPFAPRCRMGRGLANSLRDWVFMGPGQPVHGFQDDTHWDALRRLLHRGQALVA